MEVFGQPEKDGKLVADDERLQYISLRVCQGRNIRLELIAARAPVSSLSDRELPRLSGL